MSACYPIPFERSSKTCPAKTLSHNERKELAMEALKETSSVTSMAKENKVSRKFIYAQKTVAEQGVDSAFEKKGSDVLFYLPITKKWLDQFIISLILICHCSYRGVQEVLRDLFDWEICLGSVHNIVHRTINKVKELDDQEDLSQIKVGTPDEIFQGGTPVLAGCDPHSLYCYLLAAADHRDADTWAIHLMECQDKGFNPDYTVADFGSGLRAGQKEAMPDVPCFGDHFHVLYDLGNLVTYLENRAYSAIEATEKLSKKMARAKKKGKGVSLSRKLGAARSAEAQAIVLSDDIRILLNWTRELLLPIGYDFQTRKKLLEFITEELRAREVTARRIASVRKRLENNREDILLFSKKIDDIFEALAEDLGVEDYLVRKMYELKAMSQEETAYYELAKFLRRHLRWKFHMVQESVSLILDLVVRASSAIENYNSRLRNYFFLRKHVGMDYLVLLRFFLNHRKFLASENPSRKGRSAAEIMLNKEQAHWLEQLGHTLFRRAA